MALERRRGYHPDHTSFGRFILSRQARQPAMKAAQDIAAIARRIAPKGKHEGSGDPTPFSARFKVVRQIEPWVNTGTGPPNPRAIARVENDSPHAAALEFGNRRTKKHRTLGKAGAMVGEWRGRVELGD